MMENWDQKVLLKISSDPKDFWTVDDAMKGISIIGGTGSGKTSGSGKTIAIEFLKQGWGGLILCAKTDEADLWKNYCKKAGRLKDMVIFGNNSFHPDIDDGKKMLVFNPLQYEMSREGEGAGDPYNITNIFMNLHKMGNRASSDGESKGDDRFWDNALKRIISRTVELIDLAGEELTYKNMIELIYSAPTEKKPYSQSELDKFLQYVKYEEDYVTEIRENYFLKCVAKGFYNIAGEDENSANYYTYNSILKYFTISLPYMSDQTHNAIIESFMGVVEPFLSGILYKHFSGETNLYPEDIFTKNKIIILDFPIKEYLDAGIMAQCIYKLIFQQAVERRDTAKYPVPVFLWADEAQYFVNPYDQLFLTTARSKRASTVFLSQSVSNYYSVMGGKDARPKVDSLLGNLSTKIFHANSDAVTNGYASELIGEAIIYLQDTGSSNSLFNLSFSSSKGLKPTKLPQVFPKEFTTFKSGGNTNNFEVEAIVFVTGKKWSNDCNFMKTIFGQNFNP